MPNPYHDAAGRFASRDELNAKIEAARAANNWDVYYAERANLEQIEAALAKDEENHEIVARKAQYRKSFGKLSEYMEDTLLEFEDRIERGAAALQKMSDESEHGTSARLQGKAIALRSSLSSWKMIIASPTTTSVNIAGEKFSNTMDDMAKESQTYADDEDLSAGEVEGYKLAQSYERSIQMALGREAQYSS